MLRPLLAAFLALVLLVPTTVAEEQQPEKMTLTVNVSSFGFMPRKDVDWLIDQPSPGKDFKLTLKRDDQRFGFGATVVGWRGSEEIVLQDGYRLRVNARYLMGEPQGDFQGDKPGLTLDVSYYYEKQLIGFQTVTAWFGPQAKPEVTAELKDIPYFDMLSQNKFEVPAVTDGYGEGFRAWTALRDGLGKPTFESLSEALKPLKRKDNLMIPTVTVTAKVKPVKQVQKE